MMITITVIRHHVVRLLLLLY